MKIHQCSLPESLIYKERPEAKNWPWWISVLLWFKRPYYGVDQVGNDFYYVTAKYLFGKVYIVKSGEWTDKPQTSTTDGRE